MDIVGRFLLKLAQPDLKETAVRDIVSTIPESFEWDRFYELAFAHKLWGLIGHNFSQCSVDNNILPDKIYSRFIRDYQEAREINSLLVEEFHKVSRALSSHGVKVLALKGARLLADVYTDLGQRPMGDLDLLIDPADYPVTHDVFCNLGYGQFKVDSEGNVIPFNEKWHERYREILHHYADYRRESGKAIKPWFKIDLHHRLHMVYEKGHLDPKQVMSSPVNIKSMAGSFLTLRPEYFLIHLCTHLYWHSRSVINVLLDDDLRLLRIMDIHLFVTKRYHSMNWDFLIDTVQERNLQRPVGIAFYYTEKLLGNILPDVVRQSIFPPEIAEISNGIGDWYMFDEDQTIGIWNNDICERIFEDRSREALEAYFMYMRAVKTSRDKGTKIPQYR